jgi:L-fuconolactonase
LSEPADLEIIDAHLHFWDPGELAYPWLAGLPAIHRPFGPEDLDTGDRPLAAAVFVEAGGQGATDFAEVDWVERIAERWPTLAGIVAYAPVERGADAAGHLAALADRPLVVGVRRYVEDAPPGAAFDDSFVAGVRGLARHGLTFDLCVRHDQLPEVAVLVRRVPEVTFVLDHLAKPAVRAGLLDPWREDLSRLAALPNIVCKLSGLTTEADHAGWTEADVLPYLRHALAQFGPGRCLVGSDWPVATLATTYRRWLDVVGAALAEHAAAERAEVFAGTARRVYGLGPRH